MPAQQTKNVLFICTGNSVRSQMAEAFLDDYAGKFFNVYSAGVNPKQIHPKTVAVMRERGFDLSKKIAKDVNRYLGRQNFDYIITLSNEAASYNLSPLPGINSHLHWLFEDPAAFIGNEEATLAKFRTVRDQIEEKILAWLNQMQFSPSQSEQYCVSCI